ncbi:helix-turn-helix domain-containing protein [Alkalibacter mobilis]|uniref:helix-turn-helix domain-containing protein n=1 Tax=Alkalibacter mobilis TaxID=2787712 RepID=UPI0018A10C04|nr:helix-turn-helix transcriptional regulator [Alkalibacter mobilis]MBF7097602.1 helix-turn-helix transcriptional regulator [Alkalibacter mobilis]
MTRQALKAVSNVYYQARKRAGINSREEASKYFFVEPETIGKWETGKTTPGPDSVVMMSEVYNDPFLANHYCLNCPIGEKFYPKLDQKDLAVVSLQMIRSLRELEDAKDKLLDITEDGVIDTCEVNDLKQVMDFFDRMEQLIQELKLSIKKELHGDQPMTTLVD